MHQTNGICESFNSLMWHDSKLRGIRIRRRDDEIDDVVLDIEIRRTASELEHAPMTIVLEDVAFFICDLDVQGKRECGDDVSSAKCSDQSELKTKLQDERIENSPNALKEHFHFHFYLIPPGGTVDVLAVGFRISGSAD